MEVELKDFERLDLRVGEIIEAEVIEGSEKLLKLKVDIGEIRQTVAGIKPWYRPEELVGKKVIFLANLEEAEIWGVKSEGMLLAAQDEEGVSILTLDGSVENGAKIK
jgi:methionyl-tRNA synthetase